MGFLTAKLWASVTLWKYVCYLEVGDKNMLLVGMDFTGYKDRSLALKCPNVWHSKEESRKGRKTRRMFINGTTREKLFKNGIIRRSSLSCRFIRTTYMFLLRILMVQRKSKITLILFKNVVWRLDSVIINKIFGNESWSF